jgi:di/tricarboxylate transporter
VATLSVVLPLFIPLGLASGYSVAVIVLLNYIVVNIHFLLPHHHANMMIGVGKGYYDDKIMFKNGIVMMPVTFLVLALLYIPWWNFIG